MKSTIKIGSDFSGIGAFEQAIRRVTSREGNEYLNIFACDMDKYAREAYLANYTPPGYYPLNVYDRKIPEKRLDIYMTSPPCQSFSLAGKRKGKDDERGMLFFNSYEFIKKNKPRFFIFENVKGLLSDDNGNTFQEWINHLAGKSVNGAPLLFPYEKSIPYHVYYRVLNSKKYGIPQNRERVFIIGIRDDLDNRFIWPKEEYLVRKLIDILESPVAEKYFLSDKMIKGLKKEKSDFKGRFKPLSGHEENANCITTNAGSRATDNFIKLIGNTNPSKIVIEGIQKKVVCIPVLTPNRENKRQNGRRFKDNGDVSFTLTTQDQHGIYDGCKIRRLTPRECLRLQDFPDSFNIVCSDSQTYKQAGNSITVRVLELITERLIKIINHEKS